jgi:hypothetical protein
MTHVAVRLPNRSSNISISRAMLESISSIAGLGPGTSRANTLD